MTPMRLGLGLSLAHARRGGGGADPEAPATASSLLTGLRGYWSLSEGSGRYRQHAAGYPLGDVGGVPRATGGTWGAAADFADDGAKYLSLSAPSNALDPFKFDGTDWTLAFAVDVTSTADNQSFVSKSQSVLIHGFGAFVWPFYYSPGGVLQTDAPSAAIAVGEHRVLIRYRSSDRVMGIFVDGASEATGALGVAIGAGVTTTLVGQWADADKPGRCRVANLASWGRRLSDAEVAAWLAEPRYPFDGIDRVFVSEPRPYQVVQRDWLGGDDADVAVSGYYVGGTEPDGIEVKVLNANGSTYRDWATLDAAPADGLFAGTVAGLPARPGDYQIRVRMADVPTAVVTVPAVGVGDVFGAGGQSNSEGHADDPQSYTPPASGAAARFVDTLGVWSDLQDPVGRYNVATGSFYPLLATELLAESGCPVAFVPRGVGGTAISSWEDGDPNYVRAVAAWTYWGAANGVRAVVFDQGESDVLADRPQAEYEASAESLVEGLHAEFPDSPILLKKIQGGSWTSSNPTGLANVRAAQQAVADAYAYVSLYDLSSVTSDSFHYETGAELAAVVAVLAPALTAAAGY